jgi:hypothetical protein
MFFDLMIESSICIFRSGFICHHRGHTEVVIIGSDQVKLESGRWQLNLGSELLK